jgi:hypothetical protein
MYDKDKIIPGLIVFLLLIFSPIIYNGVTGGASVKPELTYPAPEVATKCVESKEFMRANHMQLLFDWRETVVRGGDRSYKNAEGETFNMSLTSQCLTCHSNKEQFCDQCHNYLSVKPYCWDCHVIPVIPKENA